jgi:hypothetical protein
VGCVAALVAHDVQIALTLPGPWSGENKLSDCHPAECRVAHAREVECRASAPPATSNEWVQETECD